MTKKVHIFGTESDGEIFVQRFALDRSEVDEEICKLVAHDGYGLCRTSELDESGHRVPGSTRHFIPAPRGGG
jgi:hypothetical protein